MRPTTRLLPFLIPLLIGTAFIGHVAAAPAGRSGMITMQFDLSHQTPADETRLWIPYPVSDAYQLIGEVHIDSTGAEAAVYTDQQFSTPMLYARWPAERR